MGLLTSTRVGDIPVLLRPAQRPHAPLVVLYHGFGPPGSPEQMAQAFPLDALDVNAVYAAQPDVGDRLPPGGLAEIQERQSRDYLRAFLLPIIDQAVGELAAIRQAVTALVEAGPSTGLVGFASGGVLINAALVRSEVAVGAAVLINAAITPVAAVGLAERHRQFTYPWDDDTRAAARQVDLLAHAAEVATRRPPPAILILQGANDDYALPADAQQSAVVLSEQYAAANHPDMIEMHLCSDAGHYLSAGSEPTQGFTPVAPFASMASGWIQRWLPS